MKTLLLMRHAKSSWKHPELSDRERPLAKRGVKASQHMGDLLAQKELVPQRIYTSPAVRAVETARHLAEVCSCSDKIEVVKSFYLAEPDAFIHFLATVPDDFERIMVIAHNPGLESLLQILSGQIETLTTAVIAHLALPIKQWRELSGETEGELIDLWRPKELPEDLFDKTAEKPHKATVVEEEKTKKDAKLKETKIKQEKEVKSKEEPAHAKKKKPEKAKKKGH